MRQHGMAPLLIALLAASCGVGLHFGCSAVNDEPEITTGGGGFAPSTGSVGRGGGHSGHAGAEDDAGLITLPDGGQDGPPDVIVNPCGSACGPIELCDSAHLGLDDNCNGRVDESCPCSSGQAHFCFKGDPSYRSTPGCYDGTQHCDENGTWADCLGGVHATESCFTSSIASCHPITAVPFAEVDLKDGTGQFSANAVAETWAVACPTGVSPCPAVGGASPADDFKPLQSGEYAVTYTKIVAGGTTESCTYPLIVGAPGLRVELEWEHDLGGSGVDLDLHLHQPGTSQPWSITGAAQDCTWSSCTVSHFSSGASNAPSWFSDTSAPPTPVNWYLDPVAARNTCYYAPRGVGQLWQSYGHGCHNPRLDLDNVSCNPTITDPNSASFCAPENVNIDFPPTGQWMRVGVHYYSNHGLSYDVHPRVKVYCNGSLAAELGPRGYFDPEAPITFRPQDGEGGASSRFWLVADVAFHAGECGGEGCVVEPIYQDASLKTPFLRTTTSVQSSFGPPYPPSP